MVTQSKTVPPILENGTLLSLSQQGGVCVCVCVCVLGEGFYSKLQDRWLLRTGPENSRPGLP